MDDEFKKKASEAFKAGADAAIKIGGIACDLGKKGYAAAKEKAKDIRERAREAKERADAQRKEDRLRAEAERKLEVERLVEKRRLEEVRLAAARAQAQVEPPICQGDPEDKNLILSRGWLLFIWWLGNVVYTIVFFTWFVTVLSNRYARGSAWLPFVLWLLALLLNRIGYEGAVGFFEMVKHLRQIRDELRRHNMREEAKGRTVQKDASNPI